MNWEALGAIGEIIAALGVIASLVYLAVQIRQNTVSVRSNTYQASAAFSAEVARMIAEDPDLARIYRVGRQQFESLTGDEKIRFITLFALQFRSYEQMFLEHRRGLIEPEIWECRRDSMLRFAVEPGFQEVWNDRKHSFTRSFREFLEQARPAADE
jgi:hypothetical protein